MNCASCGAEGTKAIWTVPLCFKCFDDWNADEEMKAIYRSLDPIPTWQLGRMKAEGKPLPPEKPQAERTAIMTAATKAWVSKRTRRAGAA